MYKNFSFLIMITAFLATGCSKKQEIPLFDDDFEIYTTEEYPSSGGWDSLWTAGFVGTYFTHVVSGVFHSGIKSFRLVGYPGSVRADGINLDISDVDNLTYEFAIMIPTGSVTGGLAGFFVKVSPSESREYNLVHFSFRGEDCVVFVKGASAMKTNFVWDYSTWYSVKVELDYGNLKMNVWIDGQQIATDIEAAPRTTSNIFHLATEWYQCPPYYAGTVYFDDIKIYEIR